MKFIVVILLCLVLIIILVGIMIALIRTIQMQNHPNQKEFLKGKVPSQLPNGFYKGTVRGLKTSWQGKRFQAAKSAGINVFQTGDGQTEKYSFKTYVAKGVQDQQLELLKIDYSGNTDPWWLRFILDEVVETSPGKLLGKVHITLIPGLPFTLGYFRLEK